MDTTDLRAMDWQIAQMQGGRVNALDACPFYSTDANQALGLIDSSKINLSLELVGDLWYAKIWIRVTDTNDWRRVTHIPHMGEGEQAALAICHAFIAYKHAIGEG